MKARAVKDWDYRSLRQWLSGFHQGFERLPVWRLEIEIGASHYVSRKTYKNEDSAKRAARKINKKEKDDDN